MVSWIIDSCYSLYENHYYFRFTIIANAHQELYNLSQPSVAYLDYEVNPRLVKQPYIFNGGLVKRGLTYHNMLLESSPSLTSVTCLAPVYDTQNSCLFLMIRLSAKYVNDKQAIKPSNTDGRYNNGLSLIMIRWFECAIFFITNQYWLSSNWGFQHDCNRYVFAK